MTNTVTTLNGLFKQVYASKIEKLVPEASMIHSDVPFVSRGARNGAQYNQPVVLTNEHGFTYASAAAGAFTIQTPVAAVHDEAQVTGTQLLLESRIDYESAARATGSPRSFVAATGHVIQNMMESFHKRLEILYMYGGATARWGGICRLDSQITDSGTTQVYRVYAETVAEGVLSGLEGAVVDIYDDDGTAEAPSTLTTTAGATTITKVTFNADGTVYLTLVGTEAELDLIATPDGTAMYVYFNTAFGNEMTGLVGIAANTGTLFAVAGGTYGLWTGNVETLTGELTFNQLLGSFDQPTGRGGLSGTASAYVPVKSWTDMMQDEAALRRHNGEKTTFQNGASGLKFAGQFGPLEVKPYNMIKRGMFLGIPKGQCRRLGATEPTFNTPGMEEEKFLYQLPSNAGFGIRLYANQAIFAPKPAQLVLGQGIS